VAAVGVARHDRALSTTALFGWAALAWPGATLTARVLLFGAYALVDGLLALIVSLLDRHEFDHGWVLLLKGLAGIATGVLTFLWLSVTAQALVYLITAWAILTARLRSWRRLICASWSRASGSWPGAT
jgi:uncharacterized membrane protein HdeD (DUF308 family)